MIGATCPVCGWIHTKADTRVFGSRFAPGPRQYVAALGGPARATREEALADQCAARLANSAVKPETAAPAPTPVPAPEPPPPDGYAPGAIEERVAWEQAARAKAWQDFLGQVMFSLQVWQLDDELRASAEDVLTWARRCAAELDSLVNRPLSPARTRAATRRAESAALAGLFDLDTQEIP